MKYLGFWVLVRVSAGIIFALMELGFGFRAWGFWGFEALESRVLGFQALGIARLGLEDCRFSVGF